MNNLIAHKKPFHYYSVDDYIPADLFESFQEVCEQVPSFTFPIPYFKYNWTIFWSKNRGCFLRKTFGRSYLKYRKSKFAKLNKAKVDLSGTKFECLRLNLDKYITLQHHYVEDLVYKNLNEFAEYSFDINLNIANKFGREYSSTDDLFLYCELQVLNLHADIQRHHHSNRVISSVTYIHPQESNGTDFHVGNYNYNDMNIYFNDIPIDFVMPWKQNSSVFFTDELHAFRSIESEKRITINNWLVDANSENGKSLLQKYT